MSFKKTVGIFLTTSVIIIIFAIIIGIDRYGRDIFIKKVKYKLNDIFQIYTKEELTTIEIEKFIYKIKIKNKEFYINEKYKWVLN